LQDRARPGARERPEVSSGEASEGLGLPLMLNEGLLHGGVTLGDIKPGGVFFKTPFSECVTMSELSDG